MCLLSEEISMSGVVQGSGIGPVLNVFLIYVDDLAKLLDYLNVMVLLLNLLMISI